MLVLITDLYSVVVPQLLQIVNHRSKISVDVISRLLWPSISPDIIIYFCLLHNKGGRFKIISTIGHVLCVLLFTNGFMVSVLIAILIFLRSMVNSGFRKSMFHHYVASVGYLIISASYSCFSLCHRNNYDSLFANQRFKWGMIGKYEYTF
jgi:hypothetical protein